MQPRKIPDAVRGEIIARAWDGETFAHIARDLGVSSYRVGRIAMREGGFPTRAELVRLQGDAICAAYQAAAWRRLRNGSRFRNSPSRTRCTRVAFGRGSRGGGSGTKPDETSCCPIRDDIDTFYAQRDYKTIHFPPDWGVYGRSLWKTPWKSGKAGAVGAI